LRIKYPSASLYQIDSTLTRHTPSQLTDTHTRMLYNYKIKPPVHILFYTPPDCQHLSEQSVSKYGTSPCSSLSQNGPDKK